MDLIKKRGFYYTIAVTFGTLFIYLRSSNITTSVFSIAVTFAMPLALAAMVGIMCERTGIVNIGIEGTLLLSSFVAFYVAIASKNIVIGFIVAMLTGVIMSLLLALMSVTWKMDQIIAGTILNILATGLTSFFYVQGNMLPDMFKQKPIPGLSNLPFFGEVLFKHGVLMYIGFVVIITLYYALFHTPWGLRSRAVGEHPSAADTAGVSVARMRYMNVAIAGAIGGLCGSYLVLELVGSWNRGFTAGKGFTALALMIFGRWNPMGALAAAMFFGLAQAGANQLMINGTINIPPQFVGILPYVMTIIVLAISAGKVRPPAAEGQPYEKGQS
jgi:simple sugar transport system permease protein